MRPHVSALVGTLFALSITTATGAPAAEPRLVADLVPAPTFLAPAFGPFGSNEHAALGERLVFAATSHLHGLELWTSDGTSAELVLDLRPGTLGAQPRALVAWGEEVYFVADDGAFGRELWATDGTAAGTRRVTDVCPGACDGIRDPDARLVALGDRLYFAADDGIAGEELWATDGTSSERVTDACPGACSACPSDLRATRDRLFFLAMDADRASEGTLWSSDGTAGGTRQLSLTVAGSCEARPSADALASTEAYFVRARTGDTGRELWTSDGLTVRPVADLCPGPCDGLSFFHAAVGDRVSFEGTTAEGSRGLYSSDGSGVATLLPASPVSPGVREATALGGDLYLLARTDAGPAMRHLELWRSQGADQPIELVTRLLPDPTSGIHGFLTTTDDFLYAAATTCFGCLDLSLLARSDGTAAGTEVIYQLGQDPALHVGPEGTIADLMPAGNRLFFVARGQQDVGDALWTSDGTTAGTHQVVDPHRDPGSAGPYRLASPASRPHEVVFGLASLSEPRLFHSDGTAAGTGPLAAGPEQSLGFHPWDGGLVYTGPASHGPAGIWWTDGATARQLVDRPAAGRDFTESAGIVYFSGRGFGGFEPWRSDLTAPGTLELADVDPRQGESGFGVPTTFPFDSSPDGFTALPTGDGVVFAAGNELGREPWVTDGTPAGTAGLGDLCPGGCGSDPEGFSPHRGELLFAALDPASGRRLWTTDGTVDGTRLHPLCPVEACAAPRLFHLGADGTTVRFFATAENGEDRMWFFEEGEEGPFSVLELTLPGGDVRVAGEVVVAGDTTFFTAHHPETGIELWALVDEPHYHYRFVGDLHPGPVGSHPTELLPVPGGILFAADGGDGHGRELWLSDGTPSGTRRLTDLAPGPLSSQPQELHLAPDAHGRVRLYFRADDGTSGLELWSMPAPVALGKPPLGSFKTRRR